MTAKIEQLIAEILEKKEQMVQQIENLKSSNAQLSQENSRLQSSHTEIQTELKKAKESIAQLESQAKDWKDLSQGSVSTTNRDAEIDELVREIENCISQLKDNA